MGNFPERETTPEKLETLRKMTVEDGSFRLSINERDAIKYALRRMKILENKLRRSQKD